MNNIDNSSKYSQTINYLYNQMPEYQRLGHSAYKPGLDNSICLDKIFGKPHTKFKSIHVAGTNGKGSTSHILSSILQEAGYKVGLYTSPHLMDFRERIKIDGKMISTQYVIDFVEKYKLQFEPIMPSFFELTMEMAFLYFAEQKVDVAIIETGLGGRLDSTNIISPYMCVITNIGLDHTQYLGNTLPKIASEKAGIIKRDVSVIIGEADNNDVKQIFIDKAKQQNSKIIFAEEAIENFSAENISGEWIVNSKRYSNLINPLGGLAQEKNTKTVLATIEELQKLNDFKISDKNIYTGFKNVINITGLMGRWQQLQQTPKIVCDTGHNSHGIKYIASQLKREKYDHLHIVFGMVNDKDVETVLSIMPTNATYYFTKAETQRAINETELSKMAALHNLKGNNFATVQQAVETAIKCATANDFIFIGGSSYVVADALPIFVGNRC